MILVAYMLTKDDGWLSGFVVAMEYRGIGDYIFGKEGGRFLIRKRQ